MRECRGIEPLLVPYIYDDLSQEERRAVEEHLRICPKCAGELEEMEETASLIRRAVSIEMDLVSARLRDLEMKVYRRAAWRAIREDDKVNRWRTIWRPWFHLASAAAALVLGIYIGASYLPSLHPARNQPQIVQTVDPDECIRKRLQRFADESAMKRLENARVINYIRGDSWSAWGEYQQVIHENPDSYLATVAMQELAQAGYKP
ncbi:TPA: zf-HC2 domain-containing protein [Candidatus Poribacteria bacterium]|nr:zf-HC2 domain-containing protein [Candidatus Poribacteria bacterium]